jgi:hypothetical protein
MKKYMGIGRLSFSKKIRISLIFSFIPIILLGVLYFMHSRYIVTESMKNESLKIIKNIQMIYIEKYIHDVENDLNLLHKDIQYSDLKDKKKMQEHMKKWAEYEKYNVNINYIYVGTKMKEMYVYPYWKKKDKHYDPMKRPWYKKALNSNEIQWVPYIDYRSEKRLISATKPIRDNDGNVVGVLGMDTTQNILSESISKINLGEDAYVMIVNTQGNIIAYKDKTRLWENVENNQWYQAVKRGDTGVFYDKKKNIFVSFSTINKNGWKVIGFIPDKYLEELLKPVGIYVGSIILISSILFFVVGDLLTKKLKNENRNICTIIEQIENQEVTALNVDYYEKDEYEEIYKTVNSVIK